MRFASSPNPTCYAQLNKRIPDRIGDDEILDHAILSEMRPKQWNADRCSLDDIRRHGLERFAKRGVSVMRSRRSIDNGDRLTHEGLETDQPIQRILDGTRHTMGVLRTRHQQRIRSSDGGMQRDNRRWQSRFQVGIEQRQVANPMEDMQHHIRRRQPRSCADQCGINRSGAQAAGNSQDSHNAPRRSNGRPAQQTALEKMRAYKPFHQTAGWTASSFDCSD